MQEVLLSVLGLLALGASVHGSFVLVRWSALRHLRLHVRGRLVLTYDDGPDAAMQPQLLQVLEQHDAKAAFFVLGEKVQAAQELCTQLRQAGHAVYSHGFRHDHAWRSWPMAEIANMQRGLTVVQPFADGPALFRPPFGKSTLFGLLYLWFTRTGLFLWTLDSGDTDVSTEDDADKVVAEMLAAKGAVVLMHCFDREHPMQEKFVLEATHKLLQAARQHGLEVCLPSALQRCRA